MAGGRHIGIEELLGQADWLRGLARHLAGQEGDGDDLAQEAWLTAHQSPPERGRPARPWLAQVMRNLLHSRRRDEGRRARREREYQESGPDRAAAVDEVYDRLALQRFLVGEVMALEESLRTVVILRYFEGLDSTRIAQLTGTPAGTVRWRLKGALDQLRKRLDARHGGNRRAWVLVLAPKAAISGSGETTRSGREQPVRQARSPRTSGGAWVMASTKTKTVVISLAGFALLAISSGLLWWGRGDARGTAGHSTFPGATSGAEGSGPGSGNAAREAVGPPRLRTDPAASPSEQTAAGCAQALTQARDEVAARDREATGLVPVEAFNAGAPNARLRAEVVPQIERQWPAAAAGAGITHAEECRGWACCMSVLFPAEESPEVEPRLRSIGTWIPVVKCLDELKMTPPSALGVAVQWLGSRPSKDRLTGKKLEEYTFCFGAQPGAPEAESAAASAAPLPDSLEGCRHELAATRARLRVRNAQLAGFRPMATLFDAGVSAPELSAQMQAAADSAGAKARAECRSGICRLRFDRPPDPATVARLRAESDLGERIHKQQQTDSDLFLTIGEMGGPLLVRVRAPLRKPSFFEGCPQPEREGNVLLRLLVPETGIPNENGVFGQASVQMVGGTLAGSPAASCLTERMAAVLSAQELPQPMVGHLRFESWTWRPGQAPTLVTPPLL